MRFVNQWSYACAKSLAGILNENHQKKSIYYFGFQIVIGGIIKTVILISVALLLGILIPTLLVVAAFSSLRVIAGGHHMDTYGKCLLVSMGLFVTAALTAQHTYQYWNLMYMAILIAVTFIAGLYALVRYAPKDTPNKPITDPQEIKKFKKLSLMHLFLWLTVTVVLTFFRLNMYGISLCFGMLLELFTITPTGHRFFDMIKHGLDMKKVKKQCCR